MDLRRRHQAQDVVGVSLLPHEAVRCVRAILAEVSSLDIHWRCAHLPEGPYGKMGWYPRF
jgi:hypothetical protein